MARHGHVPGPIIHPQNWPDDLDYRGKKVVVIGSGATAATIIPAMAPDVEHITMLQRSPTYFRAGRNVNELAEVLREVDTPEEWVHEIVRRRMLFEGAKFTERCFAEPEVVKRELMENVRDRLKPEYRDSVDVDFNPHYLPWRQRLAFVPDGDLFEAINSGQASAVTDEIESFTPTGIALKSGKHLEADIIISATGFNLCVLGDIDVHDRRRAARVRRDHHVPRRDVHGRAEHGVGVRLPARRRGRCVPT